MKGSWKCLSLGVNFLNALNGVSRSEGILEDLERRNFLGEFGSMIGSQRTI